MKARATLAVAFTSSGDEGWRSLEEIARKRSLTRAEVACQAISGTAERERRRSGCAAEVAGLAYDPDDRAARNRVMADMEAIASEWPE